MTDPGACPAPATAAAATATAATATAPSPAPGRAAGTVLGIDTATAVVSAAIGGPGGLVGSWSVNSGRRHGETLAPGLRFLCQATGVALAGIEVVAVDLGPGLFTGLRVGLATARALVSALGIAAVGFTSLELLAHPLRHQPRLVAAVVDAGRHEVFWARYRPGPAGCEEIAPPALITPGALGPALAALGEEVLVVGDGGRRYRDDVMASAAAAGAGVGRLGFADPALDAPSAATAVGLAASRPPLSGPQILPVYLRQADVRIGWSERSAPAGASPDSGDSEHA
ncbi:MAG: tRNA (adenosine(37)-N6)-threonylcarbamoyltransferase complex dimerization subunit type 1 TsaB [Acidimicrobiales bacterium]